MTYCTNGTQEQYTMANSGAAVEWKDFKDLLPELDSVITIITQDRRGRIQKWTAWFKGIVGSSPLVMVNTQGRWKEFNGTILGWAQKK